MTLQTMIYILQVTNKMKMSCQVRIITVSVANWIGCNACDLRKFLNRKEILEMCSAAIKEHCFIWDVGMCNKKDKINISIYTKMNIFFCYIYSFCYKFNFNVKEIGFRSSFGSDSLIGYVFWVRSNTRYCWFLVSARVVLWLWGHFVIICYASVPKLCNI